MRKFAVFPVKIRKTPVRKGISLYGSFLMDIFIGVVNAIGRIPDWLSLLAFPVLLIPAAVLLRVFGKRKRYLSVCLIFAACGFTLVCCEGEARYAFVWLSLFALECLLMNGIFYLSAMKRKKKQSKAEKMYEKFRLELDGGPEERAETLQRPPKISCYPEEIQAENTVAAEDAGLRLSHASELLARLRAGKLSAGDRLETDVLARTLETFRNKRLTPSELDSLNDCLASVLKLTAKYSL